MYFDYWMLCVAYVLQKLLDVIAIIDNVLRQIRYTHVRSRVCVLPLPKDTTSVCAICSVLTIDVIIAFPRRTSVLYLVK